MVIRKRKKTLCLLSSGSVNICTCVKERSVWVCGKWVRVTKSAGVGGGLGAESAGGGGQVCVGGWRKQRGNFACECLKEIVQAFFKKP